MEHKERRKKKERKKKSEIKVLTFDFLDCEEKSWDSGAIFYKENSLRFSSIRVLQLFTVFILELLPHLKYRTTFQTRPIPT